MHDSTPRKTIILSVGESIPHGSKYLDTLIRESAPFLIYEIPGDAFDTIIKHREKESLKSKILTK